MKRIVSTYKQIRRHIAVSMLTIIFGLISAIASAGVNNPSFDGQLAFPGQLKAYAASASDFTVTGTQTIADVGDCTRVSVTVSGEVTGTVDNGGGIDLITFELWDDGSLKDSQTISVPVGATMSFSVTMGFPGLYLTGAPGVGVYSYELGLYVDPFYPTDVYGSCSKRLVSTTWNQAKPYKICFDGNKDGTKDEYYVGCTAVAVGQLINYYLTHGHSDGWLDVMLRGVTVYPRFDGKRYKMTVNNGNGYETLNSGYAPTIDEAIQANYCRDQDNNSSTDAINLRNFLLNVALGLDSNFKSDETEVGLYITELHRVILDPNKLDNLLVDRFRFQDTITISKVTRRIDEEKSYIINSIDQGHPVLIFMSGVNHNKPIWPVSHLALIDGYEELPDGTFAVLINWGWGNVNGTNDTLYNTKGPIKVGHFTWDKFQLFKGTRPLN